MSQKSMKLPKLYRIIVDVQFGDMLDECNKLYDGEGYGTVFTDANGDAVIDYLKQWDSDEWTDDDIRSEEPRWVNNGTDSDRKSTRLNSSHRSLSRMPSSA